MRQQLMRQFTIACLVIALVMWFGTLAVAGLVWYGALVPSTPVVAATTIMVVTLGLQLAFIITQMLPEGRTLISVRFCGPDAWFLIISATLLPGALWHLLAGVAAPFMQGIMSGFATPVLTAALLMIGRLIQQRNYRHLVNGSAPGAR